MPRPRIVRPLTAAILSALLVAGVLGTTTQAIAAPVQKPPAVDQSERVKGEPKVLRRKDVALGSRKGRAYARVPGSDGTRSSVVAAPAAGPARSTWRVTCNNALGFDSSPSCLEAKAAFQSAIDIWARIVESPITINLDVSFAALPTDVLGSAYSPYSYTNAAGTTLHVSALADALGNRDIAFTDYGVANDPDIAAEFTTDSSIDWYFGTDGAAAAGQVDFKSVVLHELGHGLGVSGTMDVDGGGLGSFGSVESPGDTLKPIGFDREAFTALTSGSRLISLATAGSSSAPLGSALTSGSVFWGGGQGMTANGGARPKLYAPTTWQPGSSFAHLDEDTFAPGNAHSLMTPFLSANEAVHSPGSIAVGILADQGWTASLPVASSPTAPSAPTNVTGTRGNSSVTVNWTAAAANGSAITGYVATASPGGATCPSTTALTCLVSGLANGTAYTFTVRATNGVGQGPASSASAAVTPATTPSAPGSVTGVRGDRLVKVSWTAATSNGSPIVNYRVTAFASEANTGRLCDAGTALTCTVTGLTNGTAYTFKVTAANAVGASPASASSAAVTPADSTAPVLTTKALPLFTLATTAGVTFSATDASSGVASYSISYRKAAFGGSFVNVAPVTRTTAGSFSITAAKGTTYCFTVSAIDKAGNRSAASTRCTASALDDRAMTASSGWLRPTSSAYYASTITTAAKSGLVLTRTGVKAKQISLVATKCKGCGTVGVYLNGVLQKQISLNNNGTMVHKQIIPVITYTSVKTGTITIKTLNAGRVNIDGLGISQV